MTTVALVLAAGAGTRFAGSGHKLTAPLADGRTVGATALAHALDAGIGPVVLVVTGSRRLADITGTAPDDRLVEVHHPGWAQGQGSSLAAGVAAAERLSADGRIDPVGAVVVALADQPGIPAAAWRAVAGRAQTPIAVATYDGRRGHPVRLARVVWTELDPAEDRGARDLMRIHPDWVTEVACSGSPADIDTRQDLASWLNDSSTPSPSTDPSMRPGPS